MEREQGKRRPRIGEGKTSARDGSDSFDKAGFDSSDASSSASPRVRINRQEGYSSESSYRSYDNQDRGSYNRNSYSNDRGGYNQNRSSYGNREGGYNQNRSSSYGNREGGYNQNRSS